MNKKAVSTIIALTLMLLVGVTVTMTFNDWFIELSSDVSSKSKTKPQFQSEINLLRTVKQNTDLILYIQNPTDEFLHIKSVKINENNCILPQSDIIKEKGLSLIDISGCNVNSNSQALVVIYTNQAIIEKTNLVE